jgi:hypothetical protein
LGTKYSAVKKTQLQTGMETHEPKIDQVLVEHVLGLALQLEEQARTMLLEVLKVGSQEEILLRADRNLQLRDIQHRTIFFYSLIFIFLCGCSKV